MTKPEFGRIGEERIDLSINEGVTAVESGACMKGLRERK